MANTLVAITRIVNNPILTLRDHYVNKNRANAVGDALEEYVKDIFAGTFNSDEKERFNRYREVFSFEGISTRPPDLILKNGDAIETKKVERNADYLQLNSSFPKDKLYKDDPLISRPCRECEEWEEKDMVYIVGQIDNNNLKKLWVVYGDCYAAERDTYKLIKTKISEGVNSIPGVQFSDTKELGRINRIDPLKITSLRVRGMWIIQSPANAFSYLDCVTIDAKFELIAIISEEKYRTFPDADIVELESINQEGFSIKKDEIKDPNNPMRAKKIKLITYTIQ